MDLALYFRVMRRFKIIVAVGFLLAVSLAFLSVERVSFAHGFHTSFRKTATWQANAMLFVTQPGFPWGRTITKFIPGDTAKGVPSLPQADPQRLATLTGLYAQLATSDVIRAQIGVSDLRPKDGAVTVTAVQGPAYSTPAILPILQVTATGPTKARTAALANLAADRFRTWLADEQAGAQIPTDQRVVVQLINRADTAKLIKGVGKTLPIIVFLAVLGAAIGLSLVLENVRPLPQQAAQSGAAPDPTAHQVRRTA